MQFLDYGLPLETSSTVGTRLCGQIIVYYKRSRPAVAAASSSVRFPFGFLTALVDIILILAPGTAKCSVGTAAQKHLVAMLAQAQGLVIVHQHETEHHLDTQQ